MFDRIALLSLLVVLLIIPAALGNGQAPKDTAGVSVTAPVVAGKPIPVAATVGSEIVLSLPSNHTTGYRWQVVKEFHDDVLNYTGNSYKEPQTGLAGQGGIETWSFRAVGKGQRQFTVNYLRPWEKDVPPVQTQTFVITVQ